MKPIAYITKNGVLFKELPPAPINLEPLYAHPIKELTDKEIVDINTEFLAPKGCDIYTFARAILRKAQE
jgi:hypothetical protein